MKNLVVKGINGLGDRLLTISTAIDLAARERANISVDWSDGMLGEKGINMFYELFDYAPESQIISASCEELLARYPAGSLPEEIVLLEPNVVEVVYSCYPWERIKMLRYNDRLKRSRCAFLMRKIGIATEKTHFRLKDGRYVAPVGQLIKVIPKGRTTAYLVVAPDLIDQNLSYLKPSKEIREKSVGLWQQLNLKPEKTIGIHIRKTDHGVNDNELQILKELKIKSYKSCDTVYLATDSHSVQQYFKKAELPYRIITCPIININPSELPLHLSNQYTHEEVCYSAIFDMWTLANCKYLLRRGKSSFASVASTWKKFLGESTANFVNTK